MNRKIISEADGKKKLSITEKIRAEIEEQYKKEIEESYIREKENFRRMLEQEKETLEAEYEDKKRQLEISLKQQEKKAKEEMDKKVSENQKRIDDEKKAFEIQKVQMKIKIEQELAKVKSKEQQIESIISEEKRKCKEEVERIKKETNETIKRKNDEIRKLNDLIQEKNSNEAELQALKAKTGKMKKVTKTKEVKKETVENSVFNISETGAWYEIGYIILEVNKDEKDFSFPKDKVLSYYTEDEIYQDGVIIEQGTKTNVIARYEVIRRNDVYMNCVRFYSDSKVVPIYNLLGVLNFMLHIYQAKFIIKSTNQARKIKLKCLVYSEEKLKDANNKLFQDDIMGTYLLSYENDSYTNIGILAEKLYKDMHCSKKGISNEIIEKTEKMAFQKGMQIIGKEKYIEPIRYFPEKEEEK